MIPAEIVANSRLESLHDPMSMVQESSRKGVDKVKKTYMRRVADDALADRLRRLGAVLIEGVKGCGKTETARQRAASEVRLDLDSAARETAAIAPVNVLQGATPRLLDEWQLAPTLWNAVRREVDTRGEDGQFILTGSATPADDATRHTGAGRVGRLRMRTMTLAESGLSTGAVSLAALLNGEPIDDSQSTVDLDALIEETCHGGWPADRHRPLADARRNVSDYVAEVAHVELLGLDGVRRDPIRVMDVMRALARNTATSARNTILAQDASRDNGLVSDDTAATYNRALQRLWLVEPLPAWSPVLRAKSRLRTSSKHHFVDPAISASLLGAGPDELRRDLKTYGFLFESLVVRDLRVYAEAAYAAVRYYLDNTGLEVDAIIDGGFGRWAAFGIKLAGSADVIDQAARRLHEFASKVDTQSSGPPRALGIVTASGYAYTRPDGVVVIPLGTMGP
jgi:predicted AAA+ superfamily ATPase